MHTAYLVCIHQVLGMVGGQSAHGLPGPAHVICWLDILISSSYESSFHNDALTLTRVIVLKMHQTIGSQC